MYRANLLLDLGDKVLRLRQLACLALLDLLVPLSCFLAQGFHHLVSLRLGLFLPSLLTIEASLLAFVEFLKVESTSVAFTLYAPGQELCDALRQPPPLQPFLPPSALVLPPAL